MKARVKTAQLQKRLSFNQKAISSKNQLPILSCFLLKVDREKLIISSTDLEISIITKIQADDTIEGSMTVPARQFYELINSLPDEEVEIESKDNSLLITSKRTKSSFQTLPAEDFPTLFEEKGELLAVLKKENMEKDFTSVIFASSLDVGRPALSGVLMKKEETGFLLVATDGYRLSLKHTTTEEKIGSGGKEQIIVPSRVFREILNAKLEGEINVYVSEENNQLLFEAGQEIIVGRVIDAEFPSFEKIIPSDFSVSVSFDREELLKAVKICSIFARDTANIIKLSLSKEGILVSSQATGVGENSVAVEGKLKGEENEIAFNARYLLELLSNLKENSLVFEMTGPLNPGVFKIENDNSFLHLIMPIRV